MKRLRLGLESADQGILTRAAKGIEVERLRQIVAIAKSKGLEVELYSIFGLQGETVESALVLSNLSENARFQFNRIPVSQKLNLFFGSMYERY